jgi:hypothetical protein
MRVDPTTYPAQIWAEDYDGDGPMTTKIYVASSWRNTYYGEVLQALTNNCPNADIYDFKNPPGSTGFQWSQIGLDPDPDVDGFNVYMQAMKTQRARDGFHNDMHALHNCDVCLLVLPSGRSAHIEAGYAKGVGKKLIIYIPEYEGPDLMWLMADLITSSILEACQYIRKLNSP